MEKGKLKSASISNKLHSVPIPHPLPDTHSAEFAYLCASMAWLEGKTANKIAHDIFPNGKAKELMAVKHALKRAHGNNTLRLVPPIESKLRDDLEQAVHRPEDTRRISFHVVTEAKHAGLAGESGVPRAGIYAKAAELAALYIMNAARRRLDEVRAAKGGGDARIQAGDVVICNAGGRTVTETVKAMVRNPPVFDASDEDQVLLRKSLMFVAANAGYHPERFQHSANFLSVTLGELMEASHFALPRMEVRELAERHKAYVEKTALFICGAGVCNSGQVSGLMAEYFDQTKPTVPSEAVGDVAFNLIDKHGHGIDLTEPEFAIIRHLNPTLDLATLSHIANTQRVLLVLDSTNPIQKADVAIAIIKRRYATDIVLGRRLAIEILNRLKSEAAQAPH